jgi:hypothetical protein
MDAGYSTYKKFPDGSRWHCPYHQRWRSMLERCYSEIYQRKFPTYVGCTVDETWHSFAAFRSWMLPQDWQDKELDKDILIPQNTVYGPSTCRFVSKEVNYLLRDARKRSVSYPLGVDFHKGSGKFRARCQVGGGNKFLGHFNDTSVAHRAWQQAKINQIELVASRQNSEIANALLLRVHKLKYDITNNIETTRL